MFRSGGISYGKLFLCQECFAGACGADLEGEVSIAAQIPD